MITNEVLSYLGLSQDSYYDRLFMVLPRTADATIDAWLGNNLLKGIDVEMVGEQLVISAGEEGKETLTSSEINAAISMGATIRSEHVCLGVEVNTTMLTATVPAGYDSPHAHIYDDEGEVVGRKTVGELMVNVPGTEGKSLLLCAEIKSSGNASGLQMDELERFREQFPTYEVFSSKQRATWEANNVIVEG